MQLTISLSSLTIARLRVIAIQSERTVEDLAECAVEEAATSVHLGPAANELVREQLQLIARERADQAAEIDKLLGRG